MSVLNLDKTFDDFQSAYRQLHSTGTALLRLSNDVTMASDAGKSTSLVLQDLSAAFATVDHHILLDMLRGIVGISGTTLDWIRAYLSDRSSYVENPYKAVNGTGDQVTGPAALCLSFNSSRPDREHTCCTTAIKVMFNFSDFILMTFDVAVFFTGGFKTIYTDKPACNYVINNKSVKYQKHILYSNSSK